MSCPTPEQLAAISLGLTDDARLVEHAETCEACIRVRAAQSEVVDRLSDIHGRMDVLHTSSRARLLERLPVAIDRYRQSRWRRWAVGGGAAAAIVLLAFVAIAPNRLSAMDRIASAVRQTRSMSCKLTNISTLPPTDVSPARTHYDERFIYWRAATVDDQFGDLHATTSIDSTWHRPSGNDPPLRIVDLVEIHPSGKPGILIDYLARRFYSIPALHARDINNSPPLLWLQAVRERAGKVVQDLGSREIQGRSAQGILMTFDERPEFENFNPVEVWLDPQTDLPVEFRFRNTARGEAGYTVQWSVTDIEWNHDLDPRRFDTTPPAGFLDITVPQDEKSIAEIINALQLFAKLSGGHYPEVEATDNHNYATRFDADACYQKILDLAGFRGPAKDQWLGDAEFQSIQQTRIGLSTLHRVLANPKWLAGYYGDSVGPQDTDNVLLWWNIALSSGGDQYRVFYGDLRTEVVTGKQWARLVPPEIAELAE